MAQQLNILLEILIQLFHIQIPVEVNQPVAKANQRHHILSKIRGEVACLRQELVHVSAFLGMAQLINRNDMGGNVGTAFNSSLKGAFNGQLAGKINFELFQSNGLLFL